MTQNGGEYLGVLKASYDYEPQSEDEIPIKENQLVFLLQKVDDDWWKVKIKGEEDSPSGLVPSAYVEQAEHTSIARALYNYDAAAPGELSLKEDEILIVFDREDEWVLVQSQKEGGKAGFVPGNYIEESGGEGSVPEPEVEPESEPESPPPAPRAVPPSPQPPARPVSVYVDPADRVAQHPVKVQTDHIKTWAVSEVDKKNKKKKGTLGIGGGSLFFASESDKTPVQKWDTADVDDFTIEKHKHILIDIGGANPTKLHFNVGKEELAEAILTKLDDSRKLAKQVISNAKAMSEVANGEPNIHRSALTPPPRPIDGSPSKKNGVSVRFTEQSPEIIPPRESSEDGEADEESAEKDGELAAALYDFESTGPDELSVQEGERLYIIEKEGEEWWKCRNADGVEGVVPASYLESLGPSASAQSEAGTRAPAELKREEAEKREGEARGRAEKERKKAEEERARAAAEAQKKLQEKERAAAAAAAMKKQQQEKRTQQKADAAQGSSSRSQSSQKSSRASSENKDGPPTEGTRTWHDRSGQFRVEAALLGYSNGKLRLHKVNGVVIEVPSEKMSLEDMQYVERLKKKSPSSTPSTSRSPNDDDNQPLALQLPSENVKREAVAQQKKKGPQIDWFDFFLSAGCDLDDCTRYANSFERDKIDESLLPDITASTMRSLGLREGDIIRISKAIQQKYPKPKEHQVSDEELARLQEEETIKKSVSPAPNLFSGPGGVLKNNTTRRGRPQSSKSTPPSTVDLDAIGTASEQIKRTGSPLVRTSSPAGISPVQPPQRSSSAMATVSGFDDDAWTNRPGSKPPAAPTPPASAPPRAPSAPPASQPPAPPAARPAAPQESTTTAPKLAKTTEADVFDQLARLSELRINRAVPSPAPVAVAPIVPVSSPPVVVSPSPGYNNGLGMGSSPVHMGQHMQNQQSGALSPPQQNGPRGPYAPVPANQGLLQPLIATQTGFNSFVPTRPSNISPFQPQSQIGQPSFLQSQPTGFPSNPQPLISQPTGFPTSGPLLTQPTGMASGMFGGFVPTSFPNTTATPIQTNPTGFSPFGQSQFGQSPFVQSPFNNIASTPSPAPPLPMASSPNNSTGSNTSPANVFAQMKSGTFASGNEHATPQQAGKYDALRVNPQPTGWVPQAAGWGMQHPNTGFQNGYTGF